MFAELLHLPLNIIWVLCSELAALVEQPSETECLQHDGICFALPEKSILNSWSFAAMQLFNKEES